MPCIKCGGAMEGDGYIDVVHCEFADEDDLEGVEPDGGPIYCRFEEELDGGATRGKILEHAYSCWKCGKRCISAEHAEACATSHCEPAAPLIGIKLDPMLVFCESTFSAVLQLTCAVQAILPSSQDGIAAKQQLSRHIEAVAEALTKVRQAKSGLMLINKGETEQ